MTELSSIFQPAFLKHLNDYGFINSLPAFGNFKRDQYPIRMNQDSRNYVNYVTEILASRDLKEAAAKVTRATLICRGKKDLIATAEQTEFLANQIKNSTLIEVPETHFTTLFSPKVLSGIISHLKK